MLLSYLGFFDKNSSSASKNCFVGVAKIAFESQTNITSRLSNDVNIENENVR